MNVVEQAPSAGWLTHTRPNPFHCLQVGQSQLALALGQELLASVPPPDVPKADSGRGRDPFAAFGAPSASARDGRAPPPHASAAQRAASVLNGAPGAPSQSMSDGEDGYQLPPDALWRDVHMTLALAQCDIASEHLQASAEQAGSSSAKAVSRPAAQRQRGAS